MLFFFRETHQKNTAGTRLLTGDWNDETNDFIYNFEKYANFLICNTRAEEPRPYIPCISLAKNIYVYI